MYNFNDTFLSVLLANDIIAGNVVLHKTYRVIAYMF